MTITSVSMRPASVCTAATTPVPSSSMPVTRVSVITRAPMSRAARASAWVAVCGSRSPSPGTHTAPYSESVEITGMRRLASSAETSSTSRPMPRARLTPRCSSISDSWLEANRRLPTVLNTPSSR